MSDPMREAATSIILSTQAIAEGIGTVKHAKTQEAKREALASAMVNMQILNRKWNEFMVSHGRRILWNPPP